MEVNSVGYGCTICMITKASFHIQHTWKIEGTNVPLPDPSVVGSIFVTNAIRMRDVIYNDKNYNKKKSLNKTNQIINDDEFDNNLSLISRQDDINCTNCILI